LADLRPLHTMHFCPTRRSSDLFVTHTPPLETSPSEDVSPGYRSANPVSTSAATASTAVETTVSRFPLLRFGTAVSDMLVPPRPVHIVAGGPSISSHLPGDEPPRPTRPHAGPRPGYSQGVRGTTRGGSRSHQRRTGRPLVTRRAARSAAAPDEGGGESRQRIAD